MIRSVQVGVGFLLAMALVEMLQPVVRAVELRVLRGQNPDLFEPAAALAAVIAAIAQDSRPLNP
jgi:hypothetical protein